MADLKEAVRNLAWKALVASRRNPAIHRFVHAIAVMLTKIPMGAAMIGSVLRPQYTNLTAYQQWVLEHDTLTEDDVAAIRAHVERLVQPPLISVVMPVYEPDPRFLREAIASVRGQLYPHWELCIADDASPSPRIWKILQEEAARDPRIKVMRRPKNGHISAATNSALELATGEYVALMDHDDILPPHALYEVAAEVEAHPDADLIYSDEDKINADGERFEPYFKTGWNPELMLAQNMVSHLGVYRRALVTQAGGLREGFEGSQDHDLTLRVAELTTPARIRHIPAVLYHWRQQSGRASFSEADLARCAEAGRRAVEEHLHRTGTTEAMVESQLESAGWLRVRRPLPDPQPMVSVIVPTRDRAELLEQCLDGLLNRTDYGPLDVIVVDNGSIKARTFALFEKLKADPRVRVLPAPGPFNYSALNNQAVKAARGDILLLLNNDIDVIEPSWLKAMVAQAVRPEVGAVGARLLYADGRVQHGGVVLGIGGTPPVAGHLYHGAPVDDHGYFGHLRFPRNVSAVTAACLVMRKAVFEEVGGLDADRLAVAFNDVDLCLKIGKAGYQIIWTPQAELYHLESASRGADTRPEAAARFSREIAAMRERWGAVLDSDPFYNPNFDRGHGDYRVASPPNRVRPWRR